MAAEVRKPNTKPSFLLSRLLPKAIPHPEFGQGDEELDYGAIEEEAPLENGHQEIIVDNLAPDTNGITKTNDVGDAEMGNKDGLSDHDTIIERLRGTEVPDSFLMPFKEMRKTKPQMQIKALVGKEQEVAVDLFVPASTCEMNLHQRFTDLQARLLETQVQPVFYSGWALALNNTKKKQRGRQSAFIRLGSCYKQKYSPQFLAAQKLKRKSMKQGSLPFYSKFNVDEEEGFSNFNRGRWTDRDYPISKEELDQEIDNYMAERAKKNGTWAGATTSIADQPKNKINSISRTKFALMMMKIKQWRKNCPEKAAETKAVLTEYLDDQLDKYKKNSKKTLDDELATYMAEAAKKNNPSDVGMEPVAGPSGVTTNGGMTKQDVSLPHNNVEMENIEHMEICPEDDEKI